MPLVGKGRFSRRTAGHPPSLPTLALCFSGGLPRAQLPREERISMGGREVVGRGVAVSPKTQEDS